MYDVTCLDSYGEVITNLTQWDVNQSLTIENTGLTSAPLFHFCNKNSKEALVVKSTLENGVITVKVPNILLQEGIPIIAYLYAYSSLTSGKTLATIKIPVRPRPKPSDYEYVGNIDVISLALIEERINNEIQSMEDATANVGSRVDVVERTISQLQIDINAKIPSTQKGAKNGVATLDSNGLVPSSQLPSYVDDVIEGTLSTFPSTGDKGKIYVDTATNLTYRWSGSNYVEISKSIALGETAATAYAGNKGKQNADDIASLKTRIGTAEGNISSLQSSVSTNTGDIATLKTNDTTHSTDIANMKNDIIDNKTDITNIKGSITTINGDITTIKSDITTLKNDVNDINSDIDGNAIDINGHTIYGASFCDVDENNEVFLREDGSGNYIIATTISKTVFAKDLSGRISSTLDDIIQRLSALETTLVTAE